MATERSEGQGLRLIDGVIVLGKKKGIHNTNVFNIAGQDIICIQTKRGRVGMFVMARHFFHVNYY